MQNPNCTFVVEIEDDYGRFRVALPYPEATIRAQKASEAGELSDFYHACLCSAVDYSVGEHICPCACEWFDKSAEPDSAVPPLYI
jgi:hypothetical protein